jgi:N-acetylglucosaminyldiphosphoundecaprenol N-acetyl-beta-D-mannosaminyltransferase
MLVRLENSLFVIGQFEKVINFLAKTLNQKSDSQMILPCSLHDLAVKNEKTKLNFYKNIDYCTSDSMLITNYFRHKYQKTIDRVYGPDLMLAIFDHHQEKQIKIKHYLLCPNLITKKKISTLFKKKYPKQEILIDYLPQKNNEQRELLYYQKIINKKPDFIWIGIGSPKQVKIASWLKHHSKGIKIFCVGAAFEFISGQKKQAPIWMQKNNLEWLFRLINEPYRLWRRYLITIPKYLISFILKNKSAENKS